MHHFPFPFSFTAGLRPRPRPGARPRHGARPLTTSPPSDPGSDDSVPRDSGAPGVSRPHVRRPNVRPEKRRVFIDTPIDPVATPFIPLPISEAHHLANVLRLRPGDRVDVTDGRGFWHPAVLASVRRTAGVLLQPDLPPVAGPRPHPVSLYVGLPGAQAWDLIVQKCVELGVGSVRPVLTSRSGVIATSQKERWLERGRVISRQSMKQCERSLEMGISVPRLLTDAVAEDHECGAGGIVRIVAVERALDGRRRDDGMLWDVLEALRKEPGFGVGEGRPVKFCVGPEG
ncbi:hypothetical protein HK101_006820, partial [Irineochytrium annulatum]